MHLPSAPCPHMHNIKIVTESCVSTLKPWTVTTLAQSPPYILGEGWQVQKHPYMGSKVTPLPHYTPPNRMEQALCSPLPLSHFPSTPEHHG